MLDNKTKPTEADLVRLPRWAIIAFCIRCLRRAKSLLGDDWSETVEHVVTKVIEFAKGIAISECRREEDRSAQQLVNLNRITTDCAQHRQAIDKIPQQSIIKIAHSVLDSAAHFDNTHYGPSPSPNQPFSADMPAEEAGFKASANAASKVCGFVVVAGGPANRAKIESMMRKDFNRLCRETKEARKEYGSDPDNFFGPL